MPAGRYVRRNLFARLNASLPATTYLPDSVTQELLRPTLLKLSLNGNVAGWVKLPPDANAENTEFNNQPFIVASYLGVSDAKTVATRARIRIRFALGH